MPIAYPQQLTPNGGPWTIDNEGINGQLMSTMLANVSTKIVPLVQVPGKKNVVIVWGCVNDLASSVTPATCYGYIQSYCTTIHQAGAYCISVTLASNQFIDSSRVALNNSLRANHVADALVDWSGTPIDPIGAWSDTRYFQSDGVHLNEFAIQNVELPLFNAAINSLP